jgi:acyl carrier protein
MSKQEKIQLLEEIMDLDPGTLHVNDTLADYEEWDSLSALTFISEMDERFGKKITGEEIKAFITVEDAIAVMQ